MEDGRRGNGKSLQIAFLLWPWGARFELCYIWGGGRAEEAQVALQSIRWGPLYDTLQKRGMCF